MWSPRPEPPVPVYRRRAGRRPRWRRHGRPGAAGHPPKRAHAGPGRGRDRGPGLR